MYIWRFTSVLVCLCCELKMYGPPYIISYDMHASILEYTIVLSYRVSHRVLRRSILGKVFSRKICKFADLLKSLGSIQIKYLHAYGTSSCTQDVVTNLHILNGLYIIEFLNYF